MDDTEMWTDGTVVKFNPLADPLPADKCVVLQANREWVIVDCEEPKFVVCKRGWLLNEIIIRRDPNRFYSGTL